MKPDQDQHRIDLHLARNYIQAKLNAAIERDDQELAEAFRIDLARIEDDILTLSDPDRNRHLTNLAWMRTYIHAKIIAAVKQDDQEAAEALRVHLAWIEDHIASILTQQANQTIDHTHIPL